MRLPLERCRLYTFIDTAYLGGRAPVEVAKQLCDGGSDLVQLRAKGAPADEVRRLAEEIQPVLQQAGVGLVINDHWEVARQVGADFCHLGQEDFFDKGLTHASQLPRGPLLGLSTHRPEQALRSIAARPAYIAIGPVYATPTKPAAHRRHPGLCEMGGGERPNPLVRHWRNPFAKHPASHGSRRNAHLRRLRHPQRRRSGRSLPPIQAPTGHGTVMSDSF